MISSRFTNLEPNRQMTLKPGDKLFKSAKKQHNKSKQEIENARDFFLAQDNQDGIDKNPVEGAVTLQQLEPEPNADKTYSGELKANGDFEYDHSSKQWGEGAKFGAAKTDQEGITSYFTYNDPGMYERLSYYSITREAPNGTIYLERGTV
ncbi:hypothetical protein [Thioclava electrotropha]|uniref:hypothetical protein n=1 Tax=Thioclava electrotropha TaxID=1549850 RepID=UPI0023A87F62|nr:hypothetical protein [Thioclava electrotropha]